MPVSKNRVLSVSSWILYDLANTAFSMGVVSMFFPYWVRETFGSRQADTVYGSITSVSMLVILVLSPILGVMSDRSARRMPFLIASTSVCVVATALLDRFSPSVTILFFIVANIAYQAGLQFYDSLLPDVSDAQNRGRVGGLGVAIGYLGSYMAIGLGLVFGREDKAFLFTLIALLFFGLSLPCFFFVHERQDRHRGDFTLRSIVSAIRQTIRTLRDSQQYPGLGRFLIGRIFYTDAINTVIAVMALYTVNIAVGTGLSREEGEQAANVILLSAVTFAILGGFFWGWRVDRVGAKRSLMEVLRCWLLVFAAAGAVGVLRLSLPWFYAVTALAGFSLGGIWATDRPMMLHLTPPERVGEFYGLYGMAGRFSAITGPGIWALVFFICTRLGLAPTVGQGIGVFLLMTLTLAGYRILLPVPEDRRLKS